MRNSTRNNGQHPVHARNPREVGRRDQIVRHRGAVGARFVRLAARLLYENLHDPEYEPVEAIPRPAGSYTSDLPRETRYIRIINTGGVVTDYMEFAEEIETITYCDHYEYPTTHVMVDHYECPHTQTTHVMVNSYIGEGERTEPRKTPLP